MMRPTRAMEKATMFSYGVWKNIAVNTIPRNIRNSKPAHTCKCQIVENACQ
jgi:hypothetical protein